MAVLMSELGRTDAAAQAVTRSLLLRWRSDLATGVRAMQVKGTAPAALDPDRFAGAIVAGIIPMVDRGEVAARVFADLGVPYFPLVTYQQLGIEPITESPTTS